MTKFRRLICLANSYKNGGRCIAGITDDAQSEWIRPVSKAPSGAIPEDKQKFEDQSEPRALDIISVPLKKPVNIEKYKAYSFQRENWLLEDGKKLRKVGRADWNRLLELEQRPKTLWINGYPPNRDFNDRIPGELTITLTESLKLIRVSRVTLEVYTKGRKRLSAKFYYNRCHYKLRVTDPSYRSEYREKPDGLYTLGEAFLTVSLGEPFEGYSYKLVAAIIERAKTEADSSR